MQAVPNGLRQGRARIEKHLHAAEQVFAQSVVGFHGDGDRFKSCGHVEVNRRRYLAQVAQSFTHQRGRGFAFIYIERAAVIEHHAKVMVAAKGVVPRQPVDQDRRCFSQHGHRLRHLLLVGAPHTLGVDHRFG